MPFLLSLLLGYLLPQHYLLWSLALLAL